MDKALEKINELKEKLEKLYIEKDNIEDKIDFKNQDKILFSIEQNKLEKTKNKLKNRKDNIEYKQSNLKKWKKQMIIVTALMMLFMESFVIAGSIFMLPLKPALIMIAVFSVFIIAGSVHFGDINNYRLAKRYLKNHKLEEVENEVSENNKKLNLQEKQLNNIERELSDSFNKQDEILNNIDLLESEVKILEDIRSSVINEYIKDNQELDVLINKEYEKENQKQLIKKKDSNK